jgi:hypothetical protein
MTLGQTGWIRRRKTVLGLVVASGICGLLLGRYFKVYVVLPMVLVLLGPAYFLGQADMMRGILAFVFSLVAMQFCFLISGIIQVWMDRSTPQTTSTEIAASTLSTIS